MGKAGSLEKVTHLPEQGDVQVRALLDNGQL
jgi:hypothetical protein